MSSEALPYIDTHYTVPHIKESVDALIEHELDTLSSTTSLNLHPLVAAIPEIPLFKDHPTLANTLVHIESMVDPAQYKSEQGIDMSRYVLPTITDGDQVSMGEWRELVTRAGTLLQHQSTRLTNLQLLSKYGANAWRYHLMQMEAYVTQLEQQADRAESAVHDLNVTRKLEQMKVGECLDRMQCDLLRTEQNNVGAMVAIARMECKIVGMNG